MLNKQLNPKVVLIATVVLLFVIQAVYWRLLVYKEPGAPPGGGGGGGAGPSFPLAVGLDEIEVDTLSGDEPGFTDGRAWQARFCGPNAIAIAADRSLLVADSRNHRVRRISPDGRVSTAAGGGDPAGPGGSGDGPATESRFKYPSGVAVTRDGTLYVSDSGNHRICRVRDGQVTTIAGGTEGRADGTGPSARFRSPAALALDGGGILWVADAGNGQIRQLDPATGSVSTPASAPSPIAAAMGDVRPPGAAKPAGPSITAAPNGVGAPEPTSFRLGNRSPGTETPDGVRIFADTENHVVMVQRASEPPLLVAGRRSGGSLAIGAVDGPGLRATFALPCAAVLESDGTAYVADYEGNRIRTFRVPEWLRQGQPAPVPNPRSLRRNLRGS